MSEKETATGALKRLYRSFPKEQKRRFFVVLGIMAVSTLAEIVTLGAVLPFLAVIAKPDIGADYPAIASVFAALGWEDSSNLFVPVTMTFAIAALCAGAIRVLLAWMNSRFVYRLGHSLAAAVYLRILLQPYSYHLQRNSSETVAAIQKIHNVTRGVLLSLMQAVIGVAIGIGIVATLVVIDPVVSLSAFAGFGVIYLLVGRATRSKLNKNSQIVARTEQQRIQAVQEGLGGIREVLLDDTQDLFANRFARFDRECSDALITTSFIGESPRYIIEASGMVLIAVLALFMSTRGDGIESSLPTLGALALGSQRILPLMQLVHIARTRLRGSWHVLVEVLDLLELPVDEQRSERRATELSFERALSLEDVSFRYGPELADVIAGVSLSIPKGCRLGIIGTTGSGKSTLVDLMMGLLQPTEGAIHVDDLHLSDETRPAWQAIVAHVPQTIFLSDATLAENIAFGVAADEVDMDRVREAAKKAQVHDFIEGLPDGYYTSVGERGVRLSGGQRQRIGIARALYKQVKVLVFDEATSALDTETEAAVMSAIEALGEELTLVMIAHRVSTVSACDVVIRMEAGRIAQQGDYHSVVGSQGEAATSS